MKIAIFCPNWVGDVVMATPALRAMRQQYPDAEIVAILRPYVADVLDGLNLVDRMLVHDPRLHSVWRPRHPDAAWGLRFGIRLRREQFDLALLLTNTYRSGFWSWISGIKRRVGFDQYRRGWMLTDAVTPKPADTPHPAIDSYLQLAEQVGCRNLTRTMELATHASDEQQLQDFWERQPLEKYADWGVICLNPGGAYGSAKHWPVTAFAELAVQITTDFEKRVLVLCGPAERDKAREIVGLARHPAVFSLADERLSIGLTKAAVRHADLLVTTDSGPRHFAAPFNVPVVTLFGPTHIAWSETYYDRGLHLQKEVDCGPCQQRVCPLRHHRCMRDLDVSSVYRAVATLLEKYPAQTKAA